MISALVVDKLGDGKCTRCRGTGKIKEKFIEDCKTCEKGKCPHCQGSRVLTGIRDCEECQDGKCYPCGGVGLMDYRARCKVCTGTGFAPKPFPDCPTCHKQFLKTCPECMGKKQLRTVKDCPHCERGKCTSCGGEGNYANHPTCIDCHGTGKRTPFIDVGSTCPGMRTSVYTKKTEKCWMKLFFSKYPKVYTCAICKVEKSEPQQYCHCPNLSECNFNLPCCLECVQKIAVEEVACTTCEGDGDMTKYRTCRKCKGDGRCIRCDGKGLFGVMKTCSCDSGHCGGCNKKSFDIMFCEDGDKCTPRGWCADCRENRQKCETCPGDGLMPQPRCRKCKGSGKCKNCTGVGECDKERPCKKCKNGKCKECKVSLLPMGPGIKLPRPLCHSCVQAPGLRACVFVSCVCNVWCGHASVRACLPAFLNACARACDAQYHHIVDCVCVCERRLGQLCCS